MFATSIILLTTVVTALAYKPYEGVDPNTLSCDPEGQIFLLLPDYKDCNKFFMCANGKEVEFTCSSAELIFDFEAQECNWKWAGNCTLRSEPNQLLEPEGSGDDSLEVDWLANSVPIGANIGAQDDAVRSVVKPLTFEDSPSKQLQFGDILNCKRLDSAAKRVPYKGDCQRYWSCVNGIPETFYCSDGLFFNERAQSCDFEANSKCVLEQEDELKTEFILHK